MVTQALSSSRKHIPETQILAEHWQYWKQKPDILEWQFLVLPYHLLPFSALLWHSAVTVWPCASTSVNALLAIADSRTGQLPLECFSFHCSCYVQLHHWIWGVFKRHAWMSVTLTPTSTKYCQSHCKFL